MYEAYYFFNLGDATDSTEAATRISNVLSCDLEPWEHAPEVYGGRVAGFQITLNQNSLRAELGVPYEDYRYRVGIILPRPYAVYAPLTSATLCIVARHLFDHLGGVGMITCDWSRLAVARYESRQHQGLGRPELFDLMRGHFVCDVPDYATTVLTVPD